MLMTARDVARYMRLDVQTVYRKARAGEIPCYRLGKAVRFKQEKIDEFLEGGNYAKKDGTRCRSNLAIK